MELMDIITMTPTPVLIIFILWYGSKMDKRLNKKSDKEYSDMQDAILSQRIVDNKEEVQEKLTIINKRFDSVELKSEHQYDNIIVKLDNMNDDNNTGHRVLSERLSHIEGKLDIERK